MARIPEADLLLAVMGAPHASDLATSVLRIAEAVVGQGGRVQVWTCGYATMLTQASLGAAKPRNVVDWSRDYPSTAAVVRDLIAASAGALSWYSCRFCGEERGVTAHIPEVRVRPPFKFGEHVAAARKTLFTGVI
ncbi:hypothetical protein [Saccharothrix algeriensis]|uniref:Sulfur relay (Sulfurtransferase) complex TusBCD TusD component (DsrE family) n=1 Tax=Saccharothrix algeriensis TaxID=173560 RepID=A0A8T8I1I3_9PSEU|nr:hypothetical protein [Saccharothrix algeriensis]MBM7810373.1 sulfur relay (sulfurtransferase) complex TusBCD TusD component (DsrE family) [Saccharothrix algeriensis]QTR04511.1 hypothetical protein J7S33_06450 [Saccharothrix algeriensis]